MSDKTKLGTRYTCFQCGTKFYDLNRPAPTCPECSADQSEAPLRDIRSLLGKSGRRARPAPEPVEKPKPKRAPVDEDDDFDDGDLGDDDLDDDDDDDDGDDGDAEDW